MIFTNGTSDTWDKFRYVDIVAAAQDVLHTCVPRSKFALGGLENIGKKGFFVAVNGVPFLATGNLTEYGNGTNATPMGSALVLGDELDEDPTLSVM